MKPGKDILNVLSIIFVLLGFINFFYFVEAFQYISAGILIVIFLCTLPKLSKVTWLVMAAMFVMGASLFVYTGATARDWFLAVLQNRNLLMLFICAPMLSLPFYYQDYQGELKIFTQVKVRNVMGFLVMVSLFTHFISVLISIGGLIVAYVFFKPFVAQYNADDFFLKTVSRSYFSSGFWSPAWATVIIYSTLPDVQWIRVIPVAIGFSAVFTLISLFEMNREIRRNPTGFQLAEPPAGLQPDKKKLNTMMFLVFAMISSIIVLNLVTGWDLMLVVSTVALLFPLLTALLQKFFATYISSVKNYYGTSLVKVREQVALFTLVGFLARALDLSGAGLVLVNLLPDWLHNTPALMIAAIILIMTIPGLVGIHPTTIGITIVTVLQPAALGLTSYTFALALLTGWVVSLMVAPFSAVALILSGENGKSTFANSVLINWKFTIVCIVVFSLLASIVGPLMG
ncbi:MAG: hypothetical protein FWG66_04400 [Spirochaetes bacterium]|nr:hypothetical protein [Spirochaetota bacterium]